MKKSILPVIIWLGLLVVLIGCHGSIGKEPGFRFQQGNDRVSLFLQDQLITSYIYTDSLQKQVFYPINSPSGTAFTRDYPLSAREGESQDHPHHIGVWFSYGEVNGVDFWTSTWENYDGVNPRHGRIGLQSMEYALEGEKAVFSSISLWQTLTDTLLKERSKTLISFLDGHLIFDRFTTLIATEDIHFEDSKEGMFAIRVAGGLEETANGLETGGTYRNSEGQISEGGVWGNQARWVILEGELEGSASSVLFIDHPENVGYPAHWMARGYGLFAVNPLGKKAFTKGKDSLDLRVKNGDSIMFKYRLVLTTSKEVADEKIQDFVDDFSQQ